MLIVLVVMVCFKQNDSPVSKTFFFPKSKFRSYQLSWDYQLHSLKGTLLAFHISMDYGSHFMTSKSGSIQGQKFTSSFKIHFFNFINYNSTFSGPGTELACSCPQLYLSPFGQVEKDTCFDK